MLSSKVLFLCPKDGKNCYNRQLKLCYQYIIRGYNKFGLHMIQPAASIRNRLRLRHLRLLVALAERHSLRAAAEDMAMTQPAATKALQELEELVGLPLFTRHTRGMIPTVYGTAVTHYAQVVFEDLAKLRDELVAIESGDVGRVRIGAVMAPAPELLTQVIIALKLQHPRLQIVVQIETSDLLIAALQQDQLDLAIGRLPDSIPTHDLTFEALAEEALAIIARPAHALSTQKPKAGLQTLTIFPWILQPHPSPMRQIVDQTFREGRIAPPVSIVETSSILTTLPLVLASDMLAVLPDSVARYYAALGVITILPQSLRGRLAPYGLILRRNRRITPATQLVIDAVRHHVDIDLPIAFKNNSVECH
jgi:DNA-binding transcriptional LysR family regulator